MTQEIRILTWHQPWASAMGLFKNIETRPGTISWSGYRGLVAIHAGAVNHAKGPLQTINLLQDGNGLPTELFEFAMNAYELPTKAIIAVGHMADCTIMTREWIDSLPRLERCLGHYAPGRKGIGFTDVFHLPEPIPYVGRQGLTRIEDTTIRQHLIDFWNSQIEQSLKAG